MKWLSSSLILLVCCVPSLAQTILFFEDFETCTSTSGDVECNHGWRTSGTGFATIVESVTFAGILTTDAIRLRRTREATTSLSTEGYENVQVSFGVAAGSAGSVNCIAEYSITDVPLYVTIDSENTLTCSAFQTCSSASLLTNTVAALDNNPKISLRLRIDSANNNRFCYFDSITVTGDKIPTAAPTSQPSESPTGVPTSSPNTSPTSAPNTSPTSSPTSSPSPPVPTSPTSSPEEATDSPTSPGSPTPDDDTGTPSTSPSAVGPTSEGEPNPDEAGSMLIPIVAGVSAVAVLALGFFVYRRRRDTRRASATELQVATVVTKPPPTKPPTDDNPMHNDTAIDAILAPSTQYRNGKAGAKTVSKAASKSTSQELPPVAPTAEYLQEVERGKVQSIFRPSNQFLSQFSSDGTTVQKENETQDRKLSTDTAEIEAQL